MKRITIIRCPKCHYEYLPSEIYYPDKFLGEPSNIIRDSNGVIISYDGTSMNMHEEFECYNCGCTFDVEARLLFETAVNIEHSFDEDYEVEINKNEEENCLSYETTESTLWENDTDKRR